MSYTISTLSFASANNLGFGSLLLVLVRLSYHNTMLQTYLAISRLVVVLVCVICCFGCARQTDNRTTLVVWGVQTSEETKIEQAQVKEFERQNPDIKVSLLSMGAGAMNPQKLMTAIVGNTPPDVVCQDRFTIGDWASRDTFRPLNDLLAKDAKSDDPYAVKQEDYYKACWAEANFRGKVYAIPAGTDDRCLYYSKEAFREAGLDPNKPPRTWEELRAYSVKLTKYNSDGTFQRAGFIPNFGNSWLYLYSWQNGGEFMSKDGKTCTMNNPRTVEALKYMTSIYDDLKGAERLDAYTRGFAALPPEMDPFMIGRVAMKIDGDWFLQNIARYQPDLDFGVAPPPVPAARLK
ncbi:MAG: ABC transporter substrate-binding protein, partial [Armatimonadota bacterium]